MAEPEAPVTRRASRWLGRQYQGLMKADHWRVGIVYRPIHTFLTEPHVRDVEWLPRPPGRDRYVADPFGCGDPADGVVLVEDYDHADRHGRISAYRLTGGEPSGPFPVMEMPDHLSYPYLLPVAGEWWCIPENAKSRTTRAFRFDPGTLETVEVGVLVDGVRLLDPTIFEWTGLWWLFGTDLDSGANSCLRAWWAEQPLGPWTQHSIDPLKVDPASARSAGTPFVHDGALFRPAQDCSAAYGAAVTVQEVRSLGPDEFEERRAATITADPGGACPDGVHTLSTFGDATLVDGTRRSFSTPVFRHELTARGRVAVQRLPAGSASARPAADADPNLTRFESQDRVDAYDALEGLTPAEAALVQRWVPRSSRILDLGVGTGRTYSDLAGRAADYVGVDYSEAMVEAARRRFPGGRFEVGDAADLSRFDDRSFDVVVFSYNGLDYVHPFERRQRALAEIHRVLSPGGVLVMSTHNPRAIVRHVGPAAPGVSGRLRAATVAAVGTARASWSMVPARAFWSGAGYETDRVQGLLTYYATADRLLDELRDRGFRPLDVAAADHPAPRRSLVSPWTYVAAARAETGEMKVDRLAGSGAIPSIAEEWDRLASQPGATAFQTRAWVEAWAHVLEPEARLTLLTARDGPSGRLVGLLAAAEMHRRLHRRAPVRLSYVGLAGSGKGAADHLGPLAETDDIGALLLRELRRFAGRRPLLLESLSPRWAPIACLAVGGRVVRRTECPAAARAPDGRFSDAWSAKMRKNARRRARQLVDAGISEGWIPAGPGFATALDELRVVHSRRWQAQGEPGLFDAERASFLSDYARGCREPDVPWVLLLRRATGEPVAGLLGFRHNDCFSVYKTGWDPEFARLSPGIALGAEAMRWAEEQGLTVFDYLRGPRAHKKDLGCEPVTDVTVLRTASPEGAVLGWRERLSADGELPSWVAAVRRSVP